jgi:hypothetical protein
VPESGTAPERVSRLAGDASGTDGTALERPVRALPGTDGTAPEGVAPLAGDASGTDGTALERPVRALADTDGTALESPERVSRPPNGRSRRRYVARSVRREVWDRDGARCAYADDRGVRCRETTGLEIHHRKAHALGGPNTTDNLELRCKSHNGLAAEEDFGREQLDRVRPRGLRIEA